MMKLAPNPTWNDTFDDIAYVKFKKLADQGDTNARAHLNVYYKDYAPVVIGPMVRQKKARFEVEDTRYQQQKKQMLDVEVQTYRNAKDRIGKGVNLLEWLTSDVVKKAQQAYDAATDKKEIKKRVSAITPGGTFTERRVKGLKAASGFIQFDIDGQDNPKLDPPKARDLIGAQNWCAFCSLSISKKGVWGLIRAGDDVKATVGRLKDALQNLGFAIDTAPTSIVSMRFASYDADAVFNETALELPARKRKVRTARKDTHDSSSENDIDLLCAYCVNNGISIMESYEDWATGGCALSSLGESGRSAFHGFSSVSAKYDAKKTDEKFNNWLSTSGGRVTIASVFHLAKEAGVDLKQIRS